MTGWVIRLRHVSVSCLVAVAVVAAAPPVGIGADGVGHAHAKSSRHAATVGVHRSGRYRVRTVRYFLPTGPGIIYYDYPYFYARGFYPRHIRSCLSYPCSVVVGTHVGPWKTYRKTRWVPRRPTRAP
jgi:hypothetical protein